MWYGPWWAVQPNGLSLGLHLELKRRRTNSGIHFGPYIDLHLPGAVFSVGRNPIYAGELDLIRSYSRGGKRADGH